MEIYEKTLKEIMESEKINPDWKWIVLLFAFLFLGNNENAKEEKNESKE